MDVCVGLLPAPLLLVDDNGQIVDASDEACRMFGVPAASLAGRPLADFLPDPLTGRRADGTLFPVVLREAAQEGGRWVHVVDRSPVVTLEKRANMLTAQLASQDGVEAEAFITELVDWQARVEHGEKAEPLLEQLAERARALTGADGVGLSRPDGDHIVVRFSGTAQHPPATHRVPIEGSLVGACFRSGETMYVDDAESDPRTSETLNRISGSRALIHVPLRFGTQVFGVLTLYSEKPVPFSPGAVRVAELIGGLMSAAVRHAADFQKARVLREEVARAMQAWRESESRFQVFMDATPAAVFMKDVDGRFLYVNRFMERKFGRPREQWIGYTDGDLFGPEVGAAVRCNDQMVLAQDEVVEVVETEVTDGSERVWLNYKFPLWLTSDQRVLAGVAVDITELRKAQQAVEEASAAKSRFLATLSHEVRTPMNAVLASYTALQSLPLDEGQRHLLDLAERQARYLLSLLEDLLDLSRIETGQVVPAESRLDLRQLLFDVAAAVSDSSVDLQVGSDVPSQVLGDPRLLRQVLQNLVTNAVKHSGGASVRVRVGCSDGTVRFEVEDDGVGIAPGDRARIFEPFMQSQPSHAKGGLGLGLTIASRLTAAMGGRLLLDESYSEGARFVVDLALPAAPDEPAVEAVASRPPGPSLRVLLVEDNHPSLELALFLLDSRGHTVTVARNGREAVEQWAPGRFDVILMDVQMPVMDGMAATDEIRRRESGSGRVPIIALTAQAMPEQVQSLCARGFDTVITKPIMFDELFRRLDEVAVRR